MTIEEKVSKNLTEKNLKLACEVRRGVKGSSDQAYSYIISCVKDILFSDRFFDADKLKEIIVDGGNDGEIDVFYDDGEIIHIMDIKDTESLDLNSFKKFRDGLTQYIFNQADAKELGKLNNRIKARLECFYKDSTDKRIQIYIIRNSKNNFTKGDIGTFDNLLSQYSDTSIEFLNRADLFRKCLITEDYNFIWNFKAHQDDISFGKNKNEIILKLSLFELFNLVSNTKASNSDLFAKNVRNFIKNKNLSDGIINTIINDSEKFFLFHNGLTVSADNISKKSRNGFEILNPQIINGCQTANSIYEYFKDKKIPDSLKEAKVFCRIFKLEKDIIEKVCEASNTQAKITPSDLRSNDDVQIKLEKLINSIPDKDYIYERKRGAKKPKKDIIKMGDLAQWIYACKFHEPADSKNSKNKLFEISSSKSLYEKIFLGSLDPEEIEFICNCGVFVRRKIANSKKKDEKLMKYADLHIMSGMFLMQKNNDRTFSKIFQIISEIIKKRPLSGYGDDYNKIFTKNKETWKILEKKLNK